MMMITVGLKILLSLSAVRVVNAVFRLQSIGSGFDRPLLILDDPLPNGKRKFIVEQFTALVKVMDEKGDVKTFINLSTKTTGNAIGEGGLLGMAFHPNYSTNRFIFLNYTAWINGKLHTVIRRVRCSATDPNKVVLGNDSDEHVLVFKQPYSNHNGGQLLFGPKDGMLYIGTGDGGSAGDPQHRAQRRRTIFGKILRINPTTSGKAGYTIPSDNPYVNNTNGWRHEIWHFGLRNPWRFTFDKLTGDMYIGDVGQRSFEEISFAPHGSKGINFGWRRKEGFACFNPNTTCERRGLQDPLLAYGRSEGISVTGGYLYRGSNMPSLIGSYLFADFATGTIWRAKNTTTPPWTKSVLKDTTHFISTFGEDKAGELYIADLFGGGGIYKLVDD